MSIINRKIFKVTSYFIGQLKNMETKQPMPERLYEWQVIYIEAEMRTSTRALAIAVTEDDIYQLAKRLAEREVEPSLKPTKSLLHHPTEILNPQVPRKKLIEFVLDSIVIDEST